jgi:hypothetical protein
MVSQAGIPQPQRPTENPARNAVKFYGKNYIEPPNVSFGSSESLIETKYHTDSFFRNF